jgi:hypothetical protein
VFLTGLVIERDLALQGFFKVVDLHHRRRPGTAGRRGEFHGDLERVQGDPRISVCEDGQALQDSVPEQNVTAAQTAFRVVERPGDDSLDLGRFERLQNIHFRPGQQRADDLERRILGRGTYQDNHAGLDVRQEGILLGFVEAMDFVDKKNGLPAIGAMNPLSVGHDRLDLLDAREDGTVGEEGRPGLPGHDPRQRCLSSSRRAPEDHGHQPIIADHLAQDLARSDEMILADDFAESPRAHPLRERCIRRDLGSMLGKQGIHRLVPSGMFRFISNLMCVFRDRNSLPSTAAHPASLPQGLKENHGTCSSHVERFYTACHGDPKRRQVRPFAGPNSACFVSQEQREG